MNLIDIMPALSQPFALKDIDFLPKNNFERNGQCVCLSLPFADKRVYEDRLNQVCPGEWIDHAQIVVAGTKMVAVVTLAICGIEHSDVGEAPLSSENAATESYAQAFKRACSKFGLGRYIYELEKQFLPWDKQKKSYTLNTKEKLAVVKTMYQKAGLLSSAPQPEQPAPQPVRKDTQAATLEQPVSAEQIAEIKRLCNVTGKKIARPRTHAEADALIKQLLAR